MQCKKYDAENYSKEAIGKRIRNLRNKREKSLSEVSALCYMTEPALSRLENSKTFPSVITIAKLAEVLNVSADEIIFGEAPLGCVINIQMKDEEQLAVFKAKFNEFLIGGQNNVEQGI